MIIKNYKIISHDLEIYPILNYIDTLSYFAFDTETTGVNVRKDKVIGLSFCGESGKSFYISRLRWDIESQKLIQAVSDDIFIKVIQKLATKELLMWNASFDIRVVKNNFKIDLTNSLIADVMLMKHTVEEEGDFALKKVAIQLQDRIGLDLEKEANEEQILLKINIEKNGGSVTKNNYEMYKADLEVMGQYAAADADLTFRLAEYFNNRLIEENLDRFFYDIEVMPLYKTVTIVMEDRGVKLDMDLIHKVKSAIEIDINKLHSKITDTIKSYPEFKTWLEHKALAEFPASNKGKFATKLVEKYGVPLPKTKSGGVSFVSKAIESLPDEYGYVRDFLLGISRLSDEDCLEIALELYTQTEDYFNINSKAQLGEIVVDYMKIKALTTTETGKPQFDDDMIQHLIQVHKIEWARDLSNYNKLIKIKSTYIDRFLEQQEDGIFYPNFFQHRTISGRYSSDLQQLPRPKEEGEQDPLVLKYTNLIRTFFVSGKDRVFIDNDYESLEPHVFAHISNDDGLRDIFRKGYDFYSTIAIATEKLSGVSADKKADNYLGKVNKPKRQAAKSYSLGVPYGMKGYALGKTLEISTEEAEVLIDGYLNGFPNLKQWMEDSEEQAKLLGYVKSEVGRVRHLPKVKELYSKHGDRLLDYKYRLALSKRFGKKLVDEWYKDYKNGLNNAKNFQIQSLSASIVNLAAIDINRELASRSIDGWVCLQIHDQLVVNVPKSRAEECRELVQHIMENIYPLSIKLKAPANVAYNLKEGH